MKSWYVFGKDIRWRLRDVWRIMTLSSAFEWRMREWWSTLAAGHSLLRLVSQPELTSICIAADATRLLDLTIVCVSISWAEIICSKKGSRYLEIDNVGRNAWIHLSYVGRLHYSRIPKQSVGCKFERNSMCNWFFVEFRFNISIDAYAIELLWCVNRHLPKAGNGVSWTFAWIFNISVAIVKWMTCRMHCDEVCLKFNWRSVDMGMRWCK